MCRSSSRPFMEDRAKAGQASRRDVSSRKKINENHEDLVSPIGRA